jgi:hypothetical protein
MIHEPLSTDAGAGFSTESADPDFLRHATAELAGLRDQARASGHAELAEQLGLLLARTQASPAPAAPAALPGPWPVWPASVPAVSAAHSTASPEREAGGDALEARVRLASAGFDFAALLGHPPASSPLLGESFPEVEAAPASPPQVAAAPVERPAVARPDGESPTCVRITVGGRRFGRILTGGTLLIGRRDEARGVVPDLDLGPDTAVSRHHAQIERRDGSYYLIDLGSTNGTALNQRLLAANQPVPLRVGDVALLGEGSLLEFLSHTGSG